MPVLQNARLDTWTGPHFAAGVAMALTDVPWPLAAAASLGWEVIENGLLMPAFGWDRETEQNARADVITNLAGYGIMRLLLKR